MGDFPNTPWPPLNVITPFHSESHGGWFTTVAGGSLASTASNVFVDEQVYFYAFQIFQPAVAVKMSYLVGAVASGTVDLGIYDSAENLLVSTGLTAQGTINVLQELDITDTSLAPATYFMAIKCTSGTGTVFMTGTVDESVLSVVPMYIQSTGAGTALPDPATFALDTSGTIQFIAMGVHFDTLI